MTLFQWTKFPSEFRNSFIHGGVIVTDSELLPLLLLDSSDDDNRLLAAFEKSYGVSLEYFQTISAHAHKNVIEALNVACMVRVVDDWKRRTLPGNVEK